MIISTISSKGQVTIPKKIRDFLQLGTYDKIVFIPMEKGGDFADLLIVNQSKEYKAKKLISFDKKLQKTFPDFVIEKLMKSDL